MMVLPGAHLRIAEALTPSRTQTGFLVVRDFWQGLCPAVKFKNGSLEEMKVYPVDCGEGKLCTQRGRPILAKGKAANEILKIAIVRSERFCTKISVADALVR